MWTRREERRAGRARPSLTLTTAASAASPRPGCRGRTSPRPSPRWTRRRAYPSPTGARSRGGRARRRNRRSRRGPGARSPARSRSATSATSTTTTRSATRSAADRTPSRPRRESILRPPPPTKPKPPPPPPAPIPTPRLEKVRDRPARRPPGARRRRGEYPRRRRRSGARPASRLGRPGRRTRTRGSSDASAVPSDARGAFGVGGGGGRRPAPPVASRDFRANDEEVGVNVSKPLTPRASLDVRAAPRSIDGGSRGLTGDSNHPNHPNHSNQPNHVHAHTGAGAGTTDTSAEYTYGRVLAPEEELSSECEEVCLMLRHCTRLRERYLFVSELEKRPERARVDPDHSPHYPHISGVGFAPNPSAPSSPRAPPRELSFNDSVNARDERDGDGGTRNARATWTTRGAERLGAAPSSPARWTSSPTTSSPGRPTTCSR